MMNTRAGDGVSLIMLIRAIAQLLAVPSVNLRWLLSLCLMLPALSVFGVAQADSAKTASYQTQVSRNLRLAAVPLQDGVAERHITDVVQDQQGFIWVGTEEGLFRYDGDQVLHFGYSQSNPNSLAHDKVTALFIDRQGLLWVGTRGGLNKFQSESEDFSAIALQPKNAQQSSDVYIKSIAQDSMGTLWVGTKKQGLFAISAGGSTQYKHNPEDSNSLPHNYVSTIVEDQRGSLWVGTMGGGLSRFDKRRESFVTYTANPDNAQSLTSNKVARVYEDSQERLWVATHGGGVNLFDRERQTFTAYQASDTDTRSLASNNVSDLLLDTKGTLWVATDNGLSEMLDDATFVNYQHNPSDGASLSDNELTRLHLDADGVLWVATQQGLNRWNYLSNAFTYVDKNTGQLPSNLVTAVVEGTANTLWVGTKSAGLTHIDREAQTRTRYRRNLNKNGTQSSGNNFTDDHITALHMTDSGDLWVGTKHGGAMRYRTAENDFQSLQQIATSQTKIETDSSLETSPNLLPASRWNDDFAKRINSITGGAEGRLWLGTQGHGVIRVEDGQIWHYFQQPDGSDGLTDNDVLSLFEDSSGKLWVGTQSGGLLEFNPETEQFRQIAFEGDAGFHAVLDITESKDGTLWVGTAGGGLIGWTQADRLAGRETFTNITKDGDLRSTTVRSILEDQLGQLWLSSNRGLTRLDPQTMQARHFDRLSGLRGDSFYAGAKLNSRGGRLYFGSNAGLVGFYPNAITQLHEPPRITLQAATREQQLGRTYNNDAQPLGVTLDHNHDYVSFRFSALHFVSPGQNRYLYKLQGFDKEWMDPKGTLLATYTSLPPGDYSFEVLAANPEGVWSQEPAAIELTVLAPPWLSTGAKIAYVIGIIALISFFLARLQLELLRVRSSRRTLEAQVELRTIELEERNRQLLELNDKLQEASITDPLTGLLNRRSFYEFVSREVASVERGYTNSDGNANSNRRHLFFMMIDLDGFKPINDTFGHHTGDHTLVQVSELLTSCAREADTVFRWGGDEFLVIGQVQQAQDLEVLAERFRATIDEHRFDPKYGKALRLTASIGVSPYPFCETNPGIATWEQVADVADLAAYLAKTHGKNAWVHASGTEALTTQNLHQLKDNLELLVESGMVDAVTSQTETPIPGASQR